MILNKIKETIKKYNLIEKESRVLVGLSGGADSVCLTHALYSLKDEMDFEVYTAHVNHNIRGDEAKRDEEYAVSFSKSLGVECFVRSENVVEYAQKEGISEELAGRQLRYAFFDEISKKNNIAYIATAHNKNDNAETILMNFMRGSGISGLCGIPKKRGKIVRPLLEISREEIEKYCAENNLMYMTDKTNLEKIYTRNKIRLDLLPRILNGFNGNFIDVVTNNSEIIGADSDFLTECSKEYYTKLVSGGNIETEALLKLHLSMQRRIVMRMINDAKGDLNDLSFKYVEDILSLAETGQSGKSIDLPKGVKAGIEYGRLWIKRDEEKTKEFFYKLNIGEETRIPELNISVSVEYADEKKDDGAIYFSAESYGEIAVRSRCAGDEFYPLGMNGKKKLKKYFIDNKISQSERKRTGILTINGEIAYIIGKRRDKRFDFHDKGIKIIINSLK